MPCKTITDHQVHKYKQHRNKLSQAASAAKAGISERSARRIEGAQGLPSQRPQRNWRTRQDPLSAVWDSEVLPLLQTDARRLPQPGHARVLHGCGPVQALGHGVGDDGLALFLQQRHQSPLLSHQTVNLGGFCVQEGCYGLLSAMGGEANAMPATNSQLARGIFEPNVEPSTKSMNSRFSIWYCAKRAFVFEAGRNT